MKKTLIYLIVLIVLAGSIFSILKFEKNIKILQNEEMTNSEKTTSNEPSEENYYESNQTIYIDAIMRLVEKIEGANEEGKNTGEILITSEMFGDEIEEFKNSLEVEEVGGELETYKDEYLAILPYSDFLDVQKYYYVAGELVMYRREFMGIGGYANYYFLNGRLIEVKTEVESEMNFQQEKEDEIIKRARFNYEGFLK